MLQKHWDGVEGVLLHLQVKPPKLGAEPGAVVKPGLNRDPRESDLMIRQHPRKHIPHSCSTGNTNRAAFENPRTQGSRRLRAGYSAHRSSFGVKHVDLIHAYAMRVGQITGTTQRAPPPNKKYHLLVTCCNHTCSSLTIHCTAAPSFPHSGLLHMDFSE